MWDVWFEGQIVRSKIEHPWIINKIFVLLMLKQKFKFICYFFLPNFDQFSSKRKVIHVIQNLSNYQKCDKDRNSSYLCWTWSTFLVFILGISSFASAQQIGSVPKSNADLALNVLQGLQNDPISAKTNPVFSPTSVFYGLSMLYYGMGDSSRHSIY